MSGNYLRTLPLAGARMQLSSVSLRMAMRPYADETRTIAPTALAESLSPHLSILPYVEPNPNRSWGRADENTITCLLVRLSPPRSNHSDALRTVQVDFSLGEGRAAFHPQQCS